VGGGGAKSYDSKKACSSINHSILSSKEEASLRKVEINAKVLLNNLSCFSSVDEAGSGE
jgi:hypothetical protein